MKFRFLMIILPIAFSFFLGFGESIRYSASVNGSEIPPIEISYGSAPEIRERDDYPEAEIVDQVSDSTLTEYVERLEAFRTRYSFSDSIYAASQYILDKFLEFGYTEVYFDSLDVFGTVQRNVVAVKSGVLDPDRVVLIGAHYDSAVLPGVGCDPDTLAPGADDNASGVSVTLEAARVLSAVDTDATVIFVAFAAEEQGLWGSGHFAENAYAQGMDINVVLVMDEVGYLADFYWDVELNATHAENPYTLIVAEMAITYTDLIPDITFPVIPLSDHYPFHQLGYEFVLAHNGDENPHIHRCTDTIENMSIPYLTEVAEMMTASTLYFANMPQIPEGLHVANVGDGESIYVSWDPNPEIDLDGYNLYFGIQPGEYDSLRILSAVSTGDTIGNLVEGTTIYLALSAFDGEGYESILSDEVEITVSSQPLPPTGLTSTSLTDSVFLEWDRNLGELDIAGYNVYRSLVEGSPTPILLGFVADPTTSFSDDTAEPHDLYAYYVTAVDTQIPPNESDPSAEGYGRLATHDMGILLVDNTRDGSGAPTMPTDEEVDDFYEDLLTGYNITGFWDVSDSNSSGRTVMDYDIGIYSTVLWHSDVRFGESMARDTTTMRKYLVGGGNLWLSGWMLLLSLTDEDGPVYSFTGEGFVSNVFGIDSAMTTSNGDTDFIGASGLLGDFPTLHVDTTKVPLGGLFSTDIFYPPFSGSDPIYSYVSSDSGGSTFHGEAIGLTNSSTEFGFIVTDFPLFFMERDDAVGLVEAVMNRFDEPVGVPEADPARVPLAYVLNQNYPNPFNPSTMITFEIPEMTRTDNDKTRIVTTLKIFDMRGRLVKVLVDEELAPARYQVTWDGRHENGAGASSGVYFYRIRSGSFSSTRKMVLVR
jgi:hypothetical protein